MPCRTVLYSAMLAGRSLQISYHWQSYMAHHMSEYEVLALCGPRLWQTLKEQSTVLDNVSLQDYYRWGLLQHFFPKVWCMFAWNSLHFALIFCLNGGQGLQPKAGQLWSFCLVSPCWEHCIYQSRKQVNFTDQCLSLTWLGCTLQNTWGWPQKSLSVLNCYCCESCDWEKQHKWQRS